MVEFISYNICSKTGIINVIFNSFYRELLGYK